MGLGAAGVKWEASSHLGEGSEAKPGQRGDLSGRESLRVQTLELGPCAFVMLVMMMSQLLQGCGEGCNERMSGHTL